MSERTFIIKETKSMPGFKVFKDRITILFVGNVAGYRLKPFLIWHNENLGVSKNISKLMPQGNKKS